MGLSTTGILNFRYNLLDADPKLIASRVEEKKALPNLKGVKIIWIGLDETSSPQKKLSYEDRNKLKLIWETILNKSGGDIAFCDYPSKDNHYKLLPKVSPIEVKDEVLIIAVSSDTAQKILKKRKLLIAYIN